MKPVIDLNCDMGELVGGVNYDKEIMPYISSCNISCGFHSGNPALIEATIKEALKHGVSIGAHPSYNDRENFGRKSLEVKWEVLSTELRYQICALKGMVESYGGTLSHVKPHGALYNDIAKEASLASNFMRLVSEIDPKLKVFSLAHSKAIEACQDHELLPVSEGFADRKYQSVNQLRSRTQKGAVIHLEGEVLEQVRLLVSSKIKLWDSEVKLIQVDTICLHSDTPEAVNLGKKIHEFLNENNVRVAAVQ